MSTAKDWTPDQPLRADATSEQIVMRWGEFPRSWSDAQAVVAVAKEYAKACVVQTKQVRI
jgi:hypothetical protein